MGPAPKKRNGKSTWGLPRHMGGVRQSAQCPYGAAEPSWAMVRCYSRSHPPIQYTACVDLSLMFHIVPKSHPQGKKSPPWIGSGTDQSGCPTENYSDGNHTSQALSGDVNGGAATVDTMSLPLTPLVTDIQWPCWLKMGPAPKKRNGQSTWGLPRHMGGVRHSARCPYSAAEPSWAMVRCYSRSHPPIQYRPCVGLSLIFYKVTVRKKRKKMAIDFR